MQGNIDSTQTGIIIGLKNHNSNPYKADVFIYNREGTLMRQESFGAGVSSIDLNGFSSGMYVVSIINNNRIVTKTIILNRD